MRIAGTIALVVGLLVVLFAFGYDVSAPGDPAIANLDRMSQRTMILIVGIAGTAIGTFILVSTRNDPAPKRPSPAGPPMVVDPPGFDLLPGFPLAYDAGPNPQPATSFPLWKIALNEHLQSLPKNVRLNFTQAQLDWGWRCNLEPQTFVIFVLHIESLRQVCH